MLTRDQLCRLAGIKVEDLKIYNRRDQLPFSNADRERGKYSPFEAFLLIFCERLVEAHGMNRVKAAFVTRLIAQDCQHYFDTISDSSRALAEAAENVHEVMAGVAWYPADRIPYRAFVGPFSTIVDEMTAPGPVVDLVVGNASRAAVILRARANREGIDIAEVWGPLG